MEKWKAGSQFNVNTYTNLPFYVFSALCMFLCHLSGRQGHKADGHNEVDGEECLRDESLRKITSGWIGF